MHENASGIQFEDLREALIVLRSNNADLRSEVERHLHITHIMSPRVFIVRGCGQDMDRIATRSDVSLFTQACVPISILHILDNRERQWVEAWQLRWSKMQRDDGRPGRGRAWDAPGFLPPDRPD